MAEDIEKTVDTFLGVARNQLDSLQDKIKKCDFIGVIDSYATITASLQNASSLIPDLPSYTRDAKMKEAHEIHDKKHELVKSVHNFCRCEPKEPFRIVKEPPKD